jgi:hypothetical protein
MSPMHMENATGLLHHSSKPFPGIARNVIEQEKSLS